MTLKEFIKKYNIPDPTESPTGHINFGHFDKIPLVHPETGEKIYLSPPRSFAGFYYKRCMGDTRLCYCRFVGSFLGLEVHSDAVV